MPFLENLKKLIEVTKNTLTAKITMPITFGKYEPHYHTGPTYNIKIDTPEVAAAFADALAKRLSESVKEPTTPAVEPPNPTTNH